MDYFALFTPPCLLCRSTIWVEQCVFVLHYQPAVASGAAFLLKKFLDEVAKHFDDRSNQDDHKDDEERGRTVVGAHLV